MAKEVVLTGLRSNAEFHLGNYLGAILPMVDMQKRHAGQYQLNMFVPDLHSFTTPIGHTGLYERTMQNLKIYIAGGLNIEDSNTFIYRQSYIPAHSELTVILNNFSYFGELNRMTQFKEKSEELKQKSVTAGLFDYPVLMAADILIYGATWVPVGEDQQQHLEFARDIGNRFNQKFGEVFTLPKPLSDQVKFAELDQGVRVRSLRNPEKKMSKSIDDPAGTIMLTDSPDDAAQKVMSATTDSFNRLPDGPEQRKEQPGVSNLMLIKALLTGNMKLPEGNSQGYAFLKQQVAKDVKDFLMDFQAKVAQVDGAKLMKKLEEDESAMNKVANETLLKVQKAVGLRPAN
jgi:tryptophanyl-tRNA synthetase